MTDFEPVAYATWRQRVERDLKGASFHKRLTTQTLDGVTLQPIYVRADWPGDDDAAGLPGSPPYRRGGQALGPSGDRWDVRQRYAHPDPRIVGEQVATDLQRGVRSLWLVFDSALAHGGAPAGDGIVCNTSTDMHAVLEHVPLDRVQVALEPRGADLALAAALAATAERRGLSPSALGGTLGADPLGVLAQTGALPGSLADAERSLGALAAWADAEAPGLRAISVSSAAYHNAGASAAIELGASLAAAVTYLRWLTRAGLSVAAAARQIQFSISVQSDFFLEIAKLRALRQTWAHVIRSCGGDAQAQRTHIQTTTSARTKTARDPWVNMLRVTTEAFAAAAGGADALSTDPLDAAIGPPDPFARRIAINTQVILNEESHVGRVADPAGGAFYVEHLTDRLGEMAWASFQVIEAEGGLPESLLSGKLAHRIAGVAAKRAALIARRKQAITGVSEFANLDEPRLERSPATPRALGTAGAAHPTGHGANLVRSAIALIARGAEVTALCAGVRAHDGASVNVAPLPARRDAAGYEALRDRSDAHLSTHGQRPSVFLANLGPIPKHKARSSFATGFMNAGGIACIDNDGFADAEAALTAFVESGREAVVLCGSDDQYETWVEALAPRLTAAGARRVVLAGRPGAHEARYRAAGVTDFIFMGSDLLDTLAGLLDRMGVD